MVQADRSLTSTDCHLSGQIDTSTITARALQTANIELIRALAT